MNRTTQIELAILHREYARGFATKLIAAICVVALVFPGCGGSADDERAKSATAGGGDHKRSDKQADRSDTIADLSESQAILVELRTLFQQGTGGDCSVLPEIEEKLAEYDEVLDRLARSDLDLADLRANRLDLESEYSKATAYCDVAQ